MRNDIWLRQGTVDILKYLPPYLKKDHEFVCLANAASAEHEQVRLYIQDVLDQLFIDTATWGLKYWEDFVAVTPERLDDYLNRRLQIKLILNRNLIVNEPFLEYLTNQYVNDMSADVIPRNEEYYFEIQFTKDSCFDLKGLAGAIELLKPAHLGYRFMEVQHLQQDVKVGAMVSIAEDTTIEADTGYAIDPIDWELAFAAIPVEIMTTEIGCEL